MKRLLVWLVIVVVLVGGGLSAIIGGRMVMDYLRDGERIERQRVAFFTNVREAARQAWKQQVPEKPVPVCIDRATPLIDNRETPIKVRWLWRHVEKGKELESELIEMTVDTDGNPVGVITCVYKKVPGFVPDPELGDFM